MSTEQGQDTRIFVKTADATFTKIGGETTHTYKRTTPSLDTSDKDGGSGTFGQAKIEITAGGNVKLPDAGLTALEAASRASPPEIEIKIMRGAVVRYDGIAAIGNWSITNPNAGVSTWSCDIANTGVATTDAPFATASA